MMSNRKSGKVASVADGGSTENGAAGHIDQEFRFADVSVPFWRDVV